MDMHASAGGRALPHRKVELGVAAAFGILGLIVIAGSLQVGIGWGAEGPKSGFFPFYVGLAIVVSSALNFRHALKSERDRLFAYFSQLAQVAAVVGPTAVYVIAIPFAGMYLPSIVLIAGFMKLLGRYRWPASIAVSVGVMAATYVIFEKWFKVPLPKGPVEFYFGL